MYVCECACYLCLYVVGELQDDVNFCPCIRVLLELIQDLLRNLLLKRSIGKCLNNGVTAQAPMLQPMLFLSCPNQPIHTASCQVPPSGCYIITLYCKRNIGLAYSSGNYYEFDNACIE